MNHIRLLSYMLASSFITVAAVSSVYTSEEIEGRGNCCTRLMRNLASVFHKSRPVASSAATAAEEAEPLIAQGPAATVAASDSTAPAAAGFCGISSFYASHRFHPGPCSSSFCSFCHGRRRYRAASA